MISKEQINQIISNIEEASKNNNTDLFSRTRDVFQARLDTYVSRTNRFLEALEALQLVFTENISSRSLEKRGNGLKFVSNSMLEQDWSLYFQSGTAVCSIDKKQRIFYNSDIDIIGCLVILDFNGK